MPADVPEAAAAGASGGGAPVHLVDTTMYWSDRGGGGVRRYLEAKHAWFSRRRGWRHTLAVPGAPGADAGRVRLPALLLPGSGGYRLPWRRGALAARLDSLAPHLIEVGDPFRVAWAALDVAAARAIPLVAFCHSDLEAMARLFGGARWGDEAARALRIYARRVYERADLVLTPSETMRHRLLAWGLERVACQPLGVDTATFDPGRRDVGWRERLGFAPDARVLLYAGRFAPEKHLDRLAAVVRRLGAPYVLVAIGNGPTPPAGERVRCLPFLRDARSLATALASADVFVHAGDRETFGLAVLEAMACATPVVARRAGGLAELVDETVGAAVDGERVEPFADAVASMFDATGGAAARRAMLGANARRRAERHDWEQVLPILQARYRALLVQAGRGAAAAPGGAPVGVA